ncbi:MAG: PadR family transcriptional regulator [Dehalococcoidia bacterium]|nr:PadR family transcriptional regulator [Dehalococcoidia bacterium]
MSLKHGLLGFLNYGPMTGYELKKLFDTSVAHFWNAELSQIYPTLKQLESEGLVEMKVKLQADRPNRKVYTITDDGRSELVDWLSRPADPDQVREPLMIKVFFGACVSKEQITRVLRHRIEQLLEMNARYERGCSVIQSFAAGVGLNREAFFWQLTIDVGVKHNEASIRWAEEAIERIDRLDASFFGTSPLHVGTMDVRRAVEILDRLKSEMPEGSFSAQAAGRTKE